MSEKLHGTCDEKFEGLRAALDANLSSGQELGAAVVVNLDGENVVDLWGGYADEARTRPWAEDTIANVWSSTKTVTCLAALMLVDRGALDLGAPVANYWPEFAQNGKDRIEVRHLLSHTSGVSGFDRPFDVADLYDWDKAVGRLAGQAPWWEPGTASGYHAVNQGHLVGELVRRISGQPLKDFVASEIAGPLGADFQIGAREQDWGRVADVVPPPPQPWDLDALDEANPMRRTFQGPVMGAESANTAAWRSADLGAVNGHGNARSLARIMSAVALGGEVDGVKLLRPTTIDMIFDEQANGVDLVLGIPLRWGVGFGLPCPETVPSVPNEERICFWGGWGGSMIVMDLERRLTIAYMMNRMAPGIIGSDRSAAYLNAVYAAV